MFYRPFINSVLVSILATVAGWSQLHIKEEQVKYKVSRASVDERKSPQLWSDAKFCIVYIGAYILLVQFLIFAYE